MKKFLFSILLFISFCSYGQLPSGFPTQQYAGKWSRFGQYLSVDSGILINRRDTNWIPRQPGAMTFWSDPDPNGGNYFWGYNGTAWKQLGSNIVINAIDTARWNYVFYGDTARGIIYFSADDFAGSGNDSTNPIIINPEEFYRKYQVDSAIEANKRDALVNVYRTRDSVYGIINNEPVFLFTDSSGGGSALSRFGIEDVSPVNRYIEMNDHSLDVNRLSSFNFDASDSPQTFRSYLYGDNSGTYLYSKNPGVGEASVSVQPGSRELINTVSVLDATEGDVKSVTWLLQPANISGVTARLIAQKQTSGAPLESEIQVPYLEGQHTLPLSVNGSFADASGNITVSAGGGGVTSFNSRTGAVVPQLSDYSAYYAALSHTHIISDVTGLQTALDAKEPTITAGTTSQYWRGDKTWQTLPAGSTGTVTSVGLQMADVIYNASVTNSPVTTSGTLTPTLKTQSAYALLGNNTASTATPTFFTNPYLDSVRRNAGSLTVEGRVNGAWKTLFPDSTGGAAGWALRGNPINPVTDFIGTTSNNSLSIKTNNAERIWIDSTGKIGFGTRAMAASYNFGNNVNIVGTLNSTAGITSNGNVTSVGNIEARSTLGVGLASTANPNASSVVDIKSSSRGVTLPRIAATSSIQKILKSITITSGGSGYTSAPTVFINGGGAAFQTVATISGGAVTGVTFTDYQLSIAYGSAPTITFSGGGGTGATATSTIDYAEGVMFYNTTLHGYEFYNGTTWQLINSTTQ